MAAEEHRPDGKRRLPVLQSPPAPPAEPSEDRPPWQWVLIGAAATFLAWLPLAMLAERATRHLVQIEDARGVPAPAGIWLVTAHALAFCLAAFLGGLLVGRAGKSTRRREATLSGAAAGALAWLLAAAQGTPGGALTWALMLALIAGLGALAAYAGGRAGLRWRG